MRWITPIRKHSFKGPQSFEDLLALCAKNSRDTELKAVESPSEFLLRPDGKTSGGHAFNREAFRMSCQHVAPGLSSLLQTLWDESAAKEHLKQKTLIKMYNYAVRLRGPFLKGFRFVLDRSDNTIVGVVGRNYRFVSNYELLQMVRTRFESAGDFKVVSGTMSNRDMSLLSICKKSRTVVADITFQQGLAIYNSETTRQAIFLPKLIFDSSSRTYSIEPESRDTRLVHRKSKGFNRQLDTLVVEAFKEGDVLQEAVKGYTELRGTACYPRNKADKAKRLIVEKLANRKIMATPAERVVDLLASRQTPTKWDLYQALVTAAGDFRTSERALRMVAYHYLNRGKL